MEITEADILDSITIDKNFQRIITQNTKSQNGCKFHAIIQTPYKLKDVTFFNVSVEPTLYSENHTREILNYKFKNLSYGWTVENMKRIVPNNKKKASPNAVCSRYVVLFRFVGDYEINQTKVKGSVEKVLISPTITLQTHSNQKLNCMLSLFWYDSFPDTMDYNEYENQYINKCLTRVKIDYFVEKLSDYFHQELKRGLTDSNKQFLIDKIKKLEPSINMEDIDFDTLIKQAVTAKKKKFTIGQWLMSIVKMLRKDDQLRDMWRENFIEGFCNKHNVYPNLDPETFYLRFSETKLASISFVVKSLNDSLKHWDPLSENELRSKSLADYILEYGQLKHLLLASGLGLIDKNNLKKYSRTEIDSGYSRRGDVGEFFDDESSTLNFSETSPNDLNDVLLVDANTNDVSFDEIDNSTLPLPNSIIDEFIEMSS